MTSLKVRVNGAWVDASSTVAAHQAPLYGQTLAFFGDSFTYGDPGPSSPAMRFSTRTAALLSATEANFGSGGARNYLNVNQIMTQVYQQTSLPSSAPFAPTFKAAVIQASINNLNLNPIIADISIVAKLLSRAIHRLRAGGAYEAYSGNMWSFGGTWVDVATTDANSGGGVKRTTVNGSTWTLNVSSDFPGGTLRIYGPKAAGFGGVHTISVDGSAHGSIDNRDATIQGGSQTWEYPITLAAGSHTVTGVVSNINSVENINGADFEAGSTPFIAVLNTARSPNYPGGEHMTTDTDVINSNTALATMIANEFSGDPNVAVVDIDSLLGKNPANFGVDQIHPNDTGTGLMAEAIAGAITDGLS